MGTPGPVCLALPRCLGFRQSRQSLLSAGVCNPEVITGNSGEEPGPDLSPEDKWSLYWEGKGIRGRRKRMSKDVETGARWHETWREDELIQGE